MRHWIYSPLAMFDTETDSPEPTDARIITAAHLYRNAVELPDDRRDRLDLSWLLQPERDIPEEATAVHGITTEHAREHGSPRDGIVDHIAASVVQGFRLGYPLVGHNIVFDLTTLDRECRRLGLPHLLQRMNGALLGPVLDTMVIDKAQERYRYGTEEKGTRRLSRLCEVYNVKQPPEEAHRAASDALTSGRILFQQCKRYPAVRNRDVWELHRVQREWYAEQAADLQDWFRNRAREGARDPQKVCPTDWPLQPYRAEAA